MGKVLTIVRSMGYTYPSSLLSLDKTNGFFAIHCAQSVVELATRPQRRKALHFSRRHSMGLRSRYRSR